MTMKNKKRVFSIQTRNNIMLDMTMLITGLASILSGIYFLFFPVGGYQGGRNPFYGVVILFERHTWSDIHIWASVMIISLVALHIPLHWNWVTKMTRTGVRVMAGKSNLNRNSLYNLAVNVSIGLSGAICGLSGLYLLFEPSLAAFSPAGWLFSHQTWDMIHTWSGVGLIAAAILHFAIHWRWVVKVLSKYWRAFLDGLSLQRMPEQVRVPADEYEAS